MLLSLYWAMAWSGAAPRVSEGVKRGGRGARAAPRRLAVGVVALVSIGALRDDVGVSGWEVSRAAAKVTAQQFMSWVISTLSGLGNCLSH